MLNLNCLRDVMLYLNNNLEYDNSIFSSDINLKYNDDEINYSCKKLVESNCIKASLNVLGFYEIEDITMQGYDFISKISDDKFWNKVLNKVAEYGKKATITLLLKAITSVETVS